MEGRPQIQVRCVGILYYNFPLFLWQCSYLKITLKVSGTKISALAIFCSRFGQSLEQRRKRAYTHRKNATLSSGLLCLNQSASFLIPASVAWDEANQDLHNAQQDVHPDGRVPIRHDPGPAHLVWEGSSLTWGFGLCLLLPSPAQTLQTLWDHEPVTSVLFQVLKELFQMQTLPQ